MAEKRWKLRWARKRNTPDFVRFWEKVLIGDGCWEWDACRLPLGYGQIKFRGKMRRASRVAWELWHGSPPPDHLRVCHRCDNPPCVRPSHLFLGTDLDNALDKVAKGRSNLPKRPGGYEHPMAKLTPELAVEIRSRVAAGETRTAVAKDYGVSRVTITNVVTGKGHPTPP